jgi:hypothetical protein
MLEVILTKVVSIMFNYHFSFLVVSVALIGIGVSSLQVYLFPNVFLKKKLFLQIIFFSFLLAIFIPLTMYSLLNFNRIYGGVSTYPFLIVTLDKKLVLNLLVFSLIATIPFLLGGFIIALIFFHKSESFGRLYSSSLAGSAIGCGLLVFLMDAFGGLNTILVISILAALAAVLFSLIAKRRKAIIAAMVILFLSAILLPVNQRFRILKIESYKTELGKQMKEFRYEKWTSLFWTTLTTGEHQNSFLTIFNDGVGGGPVFHFDGNFDKVQFLKGSIREMAFHLKPYNQSLILGSGGGESVLAALLFGNKDITAVEINPVAVDIVKHKLSRYSGGIYSRPEVNVVIDEARSFIHRAKKRYDLIHLSLVDSFSTTLAGTFAFTENYLYSVEAFVDYLQHLTDDGVVSITRLFWPAEGQYIRYFELMRLVAIAAEALKKEGIKDIRPHIIIAGGPSFPLQQQKSSGIETDELFNFMLKKTPFKNDEIDKIRNVCYEQGFHLIAAPSNAWHPSVKEFYEDDGGKSYLERVRRTTGLDISPATDDRPFYFDFVRPIDSLLRHVLGRIKVIDQINFIPISLLVIVVLVFILLLLLPLLFLRGRWVISARIKVRALVYFACLGIAFMLIEITLIQRFILLLGHPTYSFTVVLFSLLVFSGIGSYFTDYIPMERLRYYLTRILAVLSLYLIVTAIIFPRLFVWCSDLYRWVRIVLTVGIISPMALLMGMPFPITIRLYDKTEHEMIPWVWGINGIAAVLGSVGALFLTISYGFTATLLAAAGIYVLALVTIVGFRP